MNALESEVWPHHLRNFKTLASELTVREGILVKTGCAVVPECLRRKALAVAHEGHPSAAKFKSILRERVWWHGMSKDAEAWIDSCKICATNGKPEKPTPMRRKFAPKSVWETVAVDFNGPYSKFGGISILVIVDYRSRYIIASPVKSTSFENTRKVLEATFEKEGYPQTIKSDNGPPFNGEDYKSYCRERGINAVYSTPLHPQENGLAESCMKVVNKAMTAAAMSGTNYVEELNAAVHAHNSGTHSVTKVPPEEVMMRRKIRRGLPLLCPGMATFDDDKLEQRDRDSKLQGKIREDIRRGARECPVKPGDKVVVERQTRAKAESRFDPHKYTVMQEENGMLVLSDEAGCTLRRHVSQTKRVHDWRQLNSPGDAERNIEPTANPGSVRDERKQDYMPEAVHRPARERRAPSYLRNYVHTTGQ